MTMVHAQAHAAPKFLVLLYCNKKGCEGKDQLPIIDVKYLH